MERPRTENMPGYVTEVYREGVPRVKASGDAMGVNRVRNYKSHKKKTMQKNDWRTE